MFYSHLRGSVVQLSHDHIRILYCGEAQEEYATCYSPLMYLGPLLCGRLTPTQKPVFSLSTRTQVAGGGKVELQQQLPQFKSRSQGEDTLSLTKYTCSTVCTVDVYGLYSEVQLARV